MYEFVYRNKRMVQIILALMILPFAFVGIDSYVRSGSGDTALATVAGQAIQPQEFDNALRNQQEQMRQILGQSFDPRMFDAPEVRQQVLDSLINQKVLQAQTGKLRLTATDEQLRNLILEQQAFHDNNGKFSPERYAEVLRANGLTPLSYEARLRQELAQQAVQDPLFRAAFASQAQVGIFQKLNEQGREIQIATLDPQAYLAQAKIDEAAAKAEYDKNPDSYRAPEQVKLEYLLFSQAALAPGIKIAEEEIKAQYESRKKEFSAPEERKASHILLTWEKDAQGKAKSDSKEAARKEAEALSRQLATADLAAFAKAAREKSKDPGSAAQGGDLGFFPRGQMVKPFEEAVFGMKPGEVKGPVESDFGFHIIRLTEIKAERVRPFEEVRAQLENDLRQQRASKLFAEGAEKFQNRVYELSDSYTKLAEELKIETKRTDWLTRAQVQAIALGNPKLAEVVFSPASLSGKKNSEAIDLGNNSMISARVLEHKPSAVRPFEEVKAQIVANLQRKLASELAAKDGAAQLATLQAGGQTRLSFGAPQKITRQGSLPGVNADLRKAIFAADLGKGTAVVGGPSDNGGYTIARVLKVVEPESADPSRLKALGQRVVQQQAGEWQQAYLSALKNDIKVEVKKAGQALGGANPPAADGKK